MSVKQQQRVPQTQVTQEAVQLTLQESVPSVQQATSSDPNTKLTEAELKRCAEFGSDSHN